MILGLARGGDTKVWVRRGRAGSRILVAASAVATLICYPLWQANSSGGDQSSEDLGTAAGAILAISIPALIVGVTAVIAEARRHQTLSLVLATAGYAVTCAGAIVMLTSAPEWGYWPTGGAAVGGLGTYVELRATLASNSIQRAKPEPGIATLPGSRNR